MEALRSPIRTELSPWRTMWPLQSATAMMSSWWSLPWAKPPTTSYLWPIRSQTCTLAVKWTCFSQPASASQCRFCALPLLASELKPSVSRVPRPALSLTPFIPKPKSQRSRATEFVKHLPKARLLLSPDSKASQPIKKSPHWAEAEATRLQLLWPLL